MNGILMNGVLVQLAASAFGTTGYAMMSHTRHRYLSFIAAGGILVWAVYLAATYMMEGSVFIPSLAAAFVTAVYAEILARILKAPSTLFFIPSVVALVPGRTLYFCITELVNGSIDRAVEYGWETFACALGIALGMSIAWALCDMSRKIGRWRKKREERQ